MRSLAPPRPLARALGPAALAAALWLAPLPARAAALQAAPVPAAPAAAPSPADPSPSGRTVRAAPRREAAEFPEPFALALLAVVVCGALGAFVADLVTDGGRLERWKRDGDGWTLGALGKLIVGSVAAVVLLTLNPSGGAWPPLVGTALMAGLGAEGILLSVVSSRKAQDAENARRNAEEEVRRTQAMGTVQIDAVADFSIQESRRRLEVGGLRVARGAVGTAADEGADAAFAEAVMEVAERAKAALAVR